MLARSQSALHQPHIRLATLGGLNFYASDTDRAEAGDSIIDLSPPIGAIPWTLFWLTTLSSS